MLLLQVTQKGLLQRLGTEPSASKAFGRIAAREAAAARGSRRFARRPIGRVFRQTGQLVGPRRGPALAFDHAGGFWRHVEARSRGRSPSGGRAAPVLKPQTMAYVRGALEDRIAGPNTRASVLGQQPHDPLAGEREPRVRRPITPEQRDWLPVARKRVRSSRTAIIAHPHIGGGSPRSLRGSNGPRHDSADRSPT